MSWRQRINTGSFDSWKTVWDSGSDGSGSTLDADLLDGIDSTQFLQIGTSANFISNLTAGNGISVTGTGIGRTISNTGIINATNGTLTRSGSTGSYTLGLNLGNANTWTAIQNFSVGATASVLSTTGN